MTTDSERIKNASRFVATHKAQARTNTDLEASYRQCIAELQAVVVNNPALSNYIGNLNLLKASKMYNNLSSLAASAIKGVTKYNRKEITEIELEALITSLKEAVTEYHALVGSAYILFSEEHTWLPLHRLKYKSILDAKYLGSDDTEAVTALYKAIPESITGSSVTYSNDTAIVVNNGEGSVTFLGSPIETSGLVPVGSFISTSKVTSSAAYAFTVAPALTTTTNTVSFTTTRVPVYNIHYGNHKSLVSTIYNSSLFFDVSDEEIRTCLLVYNLVPTSRVAVSTVIPAAGSAVVAGYRQLSAVCYKRKFPELMQQIHKNGLNDVCSSRHTKGAYDRMKVVSADLASLLDTRGLLR